MTRKPANIPTGIHTVVFYKDNELIAKVDMVLYVKITDDSLIAVRSNGTQLPVHGATRYDMLD